jgi:hypothetical protein
MLVGPCGWSRRGTGVDDRFHVRNQHATILRQMGLDPNRLSYFYSGLDQRLSDIPASFGLSTILIAYAPQL